MSTMARVSRAYPCPICRKPDWCLVGKSVVMCMRVVSTRTKVLSDGSVAYVHSKDSSHPDVPVEFKSRKPAPVVTDFPGLLSQWARRLGDDVPSLYCSKLGLPTSAMGLLGAQRAPWPDTVAFPMRNGSNAIVGVRLRSGTGKKWAVKGSHQGLFIPQTDPSTMAYLVEGPTNTAAALSMGVFAIGRPNNVGGVFDIQALIKNLKIKRVVIVADTDDDKIRDDGTHFNPGADGACSLAEHLGIPNCTLLLPVKDMRDFVTLGGTNAMLNQLVAQCVWRKP